MKHLETDFDLGAESGEDAGASADALQAQLSAVRDRLKESEVAIDSPQWCELALQEGRLLVNLDEGAQAWLARNVVSNSFAPPGSGRKPLKPPE